jgi:hypothetical protein
MQKYVIRVPRQSVLPSRDFNFRVYVCCPVRLRGQFMCRPVISVKRSLEMFLFGCGTYNQIRESDHEATWINDSGELARCQVVHIVRDVIRK